jgi:3-oxoacyl-[acyl-carrier-protein] synthase II
MGSITQLDPIHRGELPVAEIRLSNNELAEINQVVDFSLVTRTTLLGLIAAREGARQSGLDSSEKQFQTGLVSATTIAGMGKTVKKGVKSALDS